MNLFSEFARYAPNRVVAAILLGAGAGLGYALLIPLLLTGLAQQSGALESQAEDVWRFAGVVVAKPGFALLFFGLCAAVCIGRALAKLLLAQAASEMTVRLRARLAQRIAQAPITVLEGLGPARLTALVTEDVRRIVMGGQVLPDMLTNCVTLAGTLGFLCFLSVNVFVFVLKALAIGALTYQVPMYFGRKKFSLARVRYDDMHEATRSLIYGAKELKLDAGKRQVFLDEVLAVRDRALAQADNEALAINAVGLSYGDMFSFMVVGVVAFILVNYHTLDTPTLIASVVVLLYVAGPVTVLMNTVTPVVIAGSSLRKVEQMLGHIAAEVPSTPGTHAVQWQRIALRGIHFAHGSDAERFAIGPIDLEIAKGEITFLSGGNGSGKSTLSKLISLHYLPSQGSIVFGEQLVCDRSREHLRQHIGAIFTDYYLFDRLLREAGPATLARARHYLAAFGLDKKVDLVDGRFSTTALSDGQRKRLALMVTLLDDKQLYIFDEWAADQDPVFKDVFYRQILPELKAQGKALVVVSHDDRYFDLADVRYVFADGQLVDCVRAGAASLEPARA